MFKNFYFCKLLENKNLNIPVPAIMQDQQGQIPYVYVADEKLSHHPSSTAPPFSKLGNGGKENI